MSGPSSERLVLALSEAGPDDLPRVGGKAASLVGLVAAGLPVPPAVVLTTEAFRRAVREGPAAPALAALEARLAAGEVPAGDDDPGLVAVRAAIEALPLPDPLLAALRAALAAHLPPAPTLAVRSSGVREDLQGASFAGQYETVLGVRGEAALLAAIRRCWASTFSARVLAYAAARAGGAGGLAMAVAVQLLVPAEAAGVLFTIDPLSGREDRLVVEAVPGLGEALVSGRTDADHWLLEARTGAVLEERLAVKRLAVLPGPEGAREVALDPAEGARPALPPAALPVLAALARAVQEHHGQPMDVEWAWEGGRAFLLQARPVTRIHYAPELGEWTTADLRDGGVSSDVCAPFMASLYESVLQRTLPGYFRAIRLLGPDEAREVRWIQCFFARPYWNMGATKQVLARIPGWDEEAFDRGLGIENPLPGRRTPVTLGGLLRALPVLRALARHYREQLQRAAALQRAFPARKAPFDLAPEALAALDEAALGAGYRRLLDELYQETEATYFETIYDTQNVKQDLHAALEKARAACPDLDLLRLMSGLLDLSHLRPMRDLHTLAGRLKAEGRGVEERDVQAFQRAWPHHGARELDIRVPRWRDDPATVRALLAGALAAWDPARDPAAQAAAQRRAYEDERARAARALRWRPLLRRSLLNHLDKARAFAWWREELRDLSAQAYDLIRLWTVEVARRLQARGALADLDDVWYAAAPQILAALEGRLSPAALREACAEGRRLVRSWRAFKNPNELGTRYTEGAAAAAGASAGALPGPPPDGALRGIGGSPGRVEGTARVLLDLADAQRVGPGDVLVTPFTDPGWTPLLGRVAAVVTETGGVLSHAAVIAREYGIPAVLAVPGATRAIPDGARVVVDGSAGAVHLAPGEALPLSPVVPTGASTPRR